MSDQQFTGRSLGIVHSHAFSPTLLNAFRFGWNHVRAELRPFAKDLRPFQFSRSQCPEANPPAGAKEAKPVTFACVDTPWIPNWSLIRQERLRAASGLAFQLTPKTVIRAAGGMFYTHNELWGVVDRQVANPPFRTEATFPSDSLTPNLTVKNGFPADALTRVGGATSLISSQQDFRSGYTEQWTFSLQRMFPGQMLVEAAYVGSNSVKLPVTRDVNQPLPEPGPLAPKRRFPAYGSIWRSEDMGKLDFQSLQVKLEKGSSSGLSLLASYTLGKALELGQQRAIPVAAGRPQNNLDLSTERARTANDVRQRLAVSYVYDLIPAGSARFGRSWLTRSVLTGWRLSGIAALQTGMPFTVAVGSDPSNTGLPATDARPNRVGRGVLPASHRSVNGWFNAADFVVQPPNTFGNSGRNILDGPGFINLDAGLSKRIPLRERVHLQFRAEVFNVSNTPQFDQPDGFPRGSLHRRRGRERAKCSLMNRSG